MQIEELRYSLQKANVEGTPREIRLGRRDLGRLLIVDRRTGRRMDSRVRALPDALRPGDVLVLNNSKRIPGVLRGRTTVGGQVELRFVDLSDDTTGLCRVFPSHDVAIGDILPMRGGGRVRIVELGLTKYGLARVVGEDKPLRAQLSGFGEPIPGFFYEGHWTPEHLNPFYATEEGSVESPLAGLHFTPELLASLEAKGVHVCFVTLHSVGSWLPFLEESISDHVMWSEWFSVPPATAAATCAAKAKGGRVIACGSTALRALESAVDANGDLNATSGRTELYITPGYSFKIVDGYFTNFHQYQTSLMVLDSAFAGIQLAKQTYRDAARRGYAFFEFGDAVLYI